MSFCLPHTYHTSAFVCGMLLGAAVPSAALAQTEAPLAGLLIAGRRRRGAAS
jgi:hypothetical protein